MANLENQNLDLSSTLAAIIDTAIDGIITIDSNGIIELFNHAAARLFQYEASEVIGKNIKMLMGEPDRNQHDHYIDNYVKTRKPKIIGIGRNVKGRRKDGSLFPFRLAVSEVVLNDRIIFTGVIHDLSDITEANLKLQTINEELENLVEKRTNELEQVVNRLLESNRQLENSQKELHVALEKSQELNELKSRFVSMASHEFRTPLSTILSSASLISKYTDIQTQDKREKHVNRIKSAVNNLTGILNDFLSLGKLEEGKQSIQLEQVDLQDLYFQVVEELEMIRKPDQKLILLNESTDKKWVYSDKHTIRNILFNLLSNALKYSDNPCNIYCTLDVNKAFCTITIKDEGMGIPKHEQQYLFDRFFRASNAENIQGTGLGLHIVKRYVDLLEGEITFFSEENKGSEFTIKLKNNVV